MFTGIIQEVGRIKQIEKRGERHFVEIKAHKLQSDLVLGASVACNGICLTVIGFDKESIKVEAMEETLRRTTLSGWQRDEHINLERALRMDSFLDGHLVQGHIDRIAKIIGVERKKNSLLITTELKKGDTHLIVEKGSIAINGVSLTVAELSSLSFTVSIVGYTLEHTNLSTLRIGGTVNLEYDVIGKYVARINSRQKSNLTEEFLLENGF